MAVIEHDEYEQKIEHYLQLLPTAYLNRMLKEQLEHAQKRHQEWHQHAIGVEMSKKSVTTALRGAARIRQAIVQLGGIVDEELATDPDLPAPK